MISYVLKLEFHETNAALKVNEVARFVPMTSEFIHRREVAAVAPIETAIKSDSTDVPVFPALLISKDCGTLIAIELAAVERLHYEAVDVWRQSQIAATVGARLIPLLPLV